jgi:hypothetical protein
MRRRLPAVLLTGVLCAVSVSGSLSPAAPPAAPAAAIPDKIDLHQGWQIQFSAKVQDSGAVISTANFKPQGGRPGQAQGVPLRESL